jgi:tetratricopeptide (TPR) repeat protein
MMEHLKKLGRAAALGSLALALATSVTAQFNGRLTGEVKDKDGKPFPGVVVSGKHAERGATFETTTDKNGRYSQTGMMTGEWLVSFKGKDPNTGNLTTFYEANVRVTSSEDARLDASLKEIIEKMSAERKEEMKKQVEEENKFKAMKAHFEAGIAAVAQARATRSEMMKLPAAERGALQQQLSAQAATAVAELEQAREGVLPNDPNYPTVIVNLGDAYEEAGRYDEASAAFSKAIEIAPQQAPYYVKLGTVLARAGKAADAQAACEKGAAVDPAQASTCYRNVVIVLQNGGKMKESLDAARRSNALDPNNAEGYFFLARALVAAMEYKKEGDKFVTVVQPGTAEAYQKYLELAPTGRFANDAKEGLNMLQTLGVGIDTKINVKKKRP